MKWNVQIVSNQESRRVEWSRAKHQKISVLCILRFWIWSKKNCYLFILNSLIEVVWKFFLKSKQYFSILVSPLILSCEGGNLRERVFYSIKWWIWISLVELVFVASKWMTNNIKRIWTFKFIQDQCLLKVHI